MLQEPIASTVYAFWISVFLSLVIRGAKNSMAVNFFVCPMLLASGFGSCDYRFSHLVKAFILCLQQFFYMAILHLKCMIQYFFIKYLGEISAAYFRFLYFDEQFDPAISRDDASA